MLRKQQEPARIKQAFNLDNAKTIGVLYNDDDERFFNKIRAFCKEIKDKPNIKSIRALGFVDAKEKMLPIWQSQKLEYGYFTQDDLNWHLRPINRVTAFKNEDFDILIDFTNGNTVPILYLFKESKAKMKVAIKATKADQFADFMLIMKSTPSIEEYIAQLKKYLGNNALK